jgi:flagellar hook-associated protein 3 FlgL
MINFTQETGYRISLLDKQQEKITYQMSSGKVLKDGSDNSVLFDRYLDIESDIRVYEGLNLQLDKTMAYNNVSDDAINDIKTALDTIKTNLLESLNYGMTLPDMNAMATNLRGVRENLIEYANTRVDGEYIFSGSDTTKPALTKDSNYKINGQVKYSGENARLRKVAIDQGIYRERGITLPDVLMYKTDTTAGDKKLTFSKHELVYDEYGYAWKLNANEDKLEKYDQDGTKTGDYLTVTGDDGDPEIFTTETLDDAESNNHISHDVRSGLLLEAKHNYLDDLNKAINALEGYSTKITDGTDNGEKDQEIDMDEIRTILNDVLDKTSQQYDETNIAHAELGGRNKTFETAQERISAKITHYNILMQETNGADLAKLAMESKSLEMTYNSLYSTIAKMNNLNLVNFLR